MLIIVISVCAASHAGESSEVSVVQMAGAGGTLGDGGVGALPSGDMYQAPSDQHSLPGDSGQWAIQGNQPCHSNQA